MFLQRMTIKAMTLTEVDLAMGISFSATNSGQGSINQSFVIYSFANATSLASVLSIAATSTWATGTAPAGAPLTSIQGGWSGNLIHPMTFASTSLAESEYVVGHLFELSMANASHSASLYGDIGINSSAVTAFSAAPTVASAISTGGFSTVSAFGSTTSTVATIQTATPTLATVLSSAGLSTFRYVSQSAATSTNFNSTTQTTAASLSGSQGAHFSTTPTVATVISNAGTLAWPLLSTGGLVSANVHTATAGVNAISNLGTAAMTLGAGAALSFGFIGTASTSTNMNLLIAGILSTGAAPVSIALTTTALTYGGSAVAVQPWFQLCGS